MALLLAAALLVLGYALVSKTSERWVVSAPMLFTGVGLLIGFSGIFEVESLGAGTVGLLAEATLVLVLFTDAIRIDLSKLKNDALIPTRLLVIGLPLTLLAGAGLAYVMFDGFGLAAAFVVAAILTPTDAALGKQVVTDEQVPVRVRQSINVESGLNDGIMLPIVTVAATVLAMESSLEETGIAGLIASQLGVGVLAGVVAGWVGGRLLDAAVSRGWVEGIMRQLGTMAIGVAAFAGAELADGNGFVAAFVAGLAFGAAARDQCQGAYDFAADEGELLTLLTFLAFGVAVVGPILDEISVQTILYAIASLTIVRMVPVALSLLGSGLKLPSVLFIGWFGPRGLASILFGVFLLEDSGAAINDQIFSVVVWTVLLSILLHGATAPWLAGRYGDWYERMETDDMMEAEETFEFPIRG
ncbi:MAG: sodium:proton exchanger [Actinobacteria bacterium]|nr:MAG: sodium:proton exchanger [Actinomycetota bacterium]